MKSHIHFAIDPKAPEQAGITDIELASVNAQGLIEFSTDFHLLKSIDMAKEKCLLFYSYGNWGNARDLQFSMMQQARRIQRRLSTLGDLYPAAGVIFLIYQKLFNSMLRP